jgi:formylglycine-generating enzyme required for sulfatase activity
VAQSPTAPANGSAQDFAPQAGDRASEFRRILKMSRLCLDGEEMSDDNRDAMCNLGESLGLTGGEAEDLIDEYLEAMANMPIPPPTPAGAARGPAVPSRVPVAVPVRPATGAQPAVRPATGTMPAAGGKAINLSPVARAEEKQKHPNFVNSVGVEMYLVPSGMFRMGSDTPDAQVNEQPVTPVIVTCFQMGRYAITNVMYEKFDPSHRNKRGAWADDNHPVIYVSAIEAEAFCKWLSQRENKKYRLPSEAEWEYAARGGEVRIFPWGDRTINGQLANFADSRTQFAWRDPSVDDGFAETAPIGSFPRGASPFGIEDMAGNVFEWCLDSLEPYKGKESVNPKVQKTSDKRVYRGGSWKSRISSLRCCARNSNVPNYQSNDVGFRIVCECA